MIILEDVTKYYKYKDFKHFVFKDINAIIPSKKNIGILGPNGAGKSTLLRILGGFETPNRGKIITDQLISFPIGVGNSFVGLLTARENVKFVCRIYGKNIEETNEIVKYVIDFSEIGDYFDLPIKTYSSGMKSRVSFGLSMAFDFDYYLVDETLSVGDKNFKAKAARTFKEKRKSASTILVSHSMGTLKENCEMGIYVNKGTLTFFDKIDDAIAAYNSENPPKTIIK